MARDRRLLMAAIVGIGVGVLGSSAQAQETLETATCSTEAECACLEALQAGTPEALEAYLQAYPSEATACNVRAEDLEELIHSDDGRSRGGSPS